MFIVFRVDCLIKNADVKFGINYVQGWKFCIYAIMIPYLFKLNT